MTFKDLVKKAEILEERYFKYSLPKDKEQQLYDFYVLSYLKYLLTLPAQNFRDLPESLEATVNDAIKELYPKLRTELLDAVFYAICAEFRHWTQFKSFNEDLLKKTDDPKFNALMKSYLKYGKFHGKSTSEKEELTGQWRVKAPEAKKKAPKREAQHNSAYSNSFDAANYAIEKNNLLPEDFVKLAKLLYGKGQWNGAYGGKAWERITDGWLRLNDAEKLPTATLGKEDQKLIKSQAEDMGVAIDHVYDLQHNTDTVFNKLKAYYKDGYSWIGRALDHKANAKSYYDLLKKATPLVRQITPPVLYNKLGQTWEKRLNELYPKKDDPKLQSKSEPEKTNEVKFDGGDLVTCINASGAPNITKGDKYNVLYAAVDSGGTPYVKIIDDSGSEQNYDQSRFELAYSAEQIAQAPDLNLDLDNSGSENGKIKTNDIVKCIDNHNVSTLLTVGKHYVVMSVGDAWIETINDKNKPGLFQSDRFELVSSSDSSSSAKSNAPTNNPTTFPEPAKTPPDYVAGDDIVCINDNSMWGGKSPFTVGKVYKAINIIQHSESQNYNVEVKNDNGDVIQVFTTRFKKAPNTSKNAPPNKVKIGDMVECIDNIGGGLSLTIGKQYEIKNITGRGKHVYYHVVNDLGADIDYSSNRFKPVGADNSSQNNTPTNKPTSLPAHSTRAPNFNTGDEIVCINDYGATSYLTYGKTYTALDVYKSGNTLNYHVKVKNDKGETQTLHVNRFKNADEPQIEVEQPAQSEQYPKYPWTAEEIKNTKVGDYVLWNERPWSGIKLGDKVKVLNVIIDHDAPHYSYFRVPDGNRTVSFFAQRFKPDTSGQSQSDEDNYTAPQEQQPEPPNTEEYEWTYQEVQNLKPGDKVIWGHHNYGVSDMTKGQTYTIKQISPNANEIGTSLVNVENDNGYNVGWYIQRYLPVKKTETQEQVPTSPKVPEESKYPWTNEEVENLKPGAKLIYTFNGNPHSGMTEGNTYEMIDLMKSAYSGKPHFAIVKIYNDKHETKSFYLRRFKPAEQQKPPSDINAVQEGDQVANSELGPYVVKAIDGFEHEFQLRDPAGAPGTYYLKFTDYEKNGWKIVKKGRRKGKIPNQEPWDGKI